MRMIDADELIKHFKNQDVEGMNLAIDLYAIDCINNAPTIDHVRHGEWKEREADAEHWQSAKCSVCGRYHTTPYMYSFKNYNYCPNCGARMDAE